MCCLWQGMLHHTLLKDAGKLEGMYEQALNRICNQVRLFTEGAQISDAGAHAIICACNEDPAVNQSAQSVRCTSVR